MEIEGRKKLLREEGYSEKAIKYLEEDKNVGELDGPSAVGEFTGECGDTIITYLQVEGDKIKDCSFLYTGCAGAGSSGSAICELVKNKKVQEAEKLSVKDIANHLSQGDKGLPEHKLDCAEIALGSIQDAIDKL